MFGKEQWVVLTYYVAKELPGVRISLPGVKGERERWPWWLGDYSYSKINSKILPISALFAMQYGRVLDRIIGEIVIYKPALGPLHILKTDISDGFYLICLRLTDAPNMGLLF